MFDRLAKTTLFIDSNGESIKHQQLQWIAGQLEEFGGRERFTHVRAYEAEVKGTRPYLLRRRPFLDIEFAPDSLILQNIDHMPALGQSLEDNKITVTPTIRLYSFGMGVLRLKINILTSTGTDSAIREIVHSADNSQATPLDDGVAGFVIQDLNELLRSPPENGFKIGLQNCLQRVEDDVMRRCIKARIVTLAHQRISVKNSISPETIIEISTLDRGRSRNHAPMFSWRGQAGKEPLYGYFAHIINNLLGEPLVKIYRQVDKEFMESSVRFDLTANSHIENLPSPALDDKWHAKEGQNPYVSIFLPHYGEPDEGMSFDDLSTMFKAQLELQKAEFSRILMRTTWARVRDDWAPIAKARENVFYSDLLHMGIHLRGAFCYYYLPTTATGFKKFPELRNSYKYREEMGRIISDQRLLWYAYNRFDDIATKQIEERSKEFKVLMRYVRDGHFPEVIEGLEKLVRKIDYLKSSLAQIMVDPQSREGGSSLFAEILDQTSLSFHLPELYRNLRHKLDRLDMLGLHVGETLHECSSLKVAEGTRSTQLTLEFLEAFIVGFYTSEITHYIGLQYGEGKFPLPLSWWPIFYLIASGSFLTILPWLIMIRKSFSKFEIAEPRWLRRFTKIAAVVGPTILGIIATVSILFSWNAEKLADHKYVLVQNGSITDYLGVFLVVIVWFLVVSSWWCRQKEHEDEGLCIRLRRVLRIRNYY
ncbi:MAG TPA: hypothetical protein ENI11_00755 [Actinobacteria bacterium]|nr:hypothetical protein [Actinomycetota bacterium]